MSRQIGSLHRSNSHPANFQNPLPIIPLFVFPPPDSPQTNTSSGMKSETKSDIRIYTTISQFNNSDIENPDEFADSELSPTTHTQTSSSTFSKPPFRPIQPQNQHTSPYSPSQVTPTYSTFNNERSTNNSPDNIQISEELDSFITFQQQLLSPHILTIHQLSSKVTSLNLPTSTPISDYTPSLPHSSTSTETSISTNRAYRTFKRKFSKHPFPSKPGTAREYVNHPDYTNTPNYLQITLPLFPQYTLNQSDPNPEPHRFVDEHVLKPTLHWTAYYNFTNPLTLPLLNTTVDIERNRNELFSLTTTLTSRPFTSVGYKKLLKTFTAPRDNDYSIEYYDHNIIRSNQDQFLDDDQFANPQVTETFFIKTSYLFTLNILDKKHDHIISVALSAIQAYKSFHKKFQTFSLTFHFLPPKERDLHCSHDIMLRTKQTHTYTYYRFIQNHFHTHTTSGQPHHRFQFINFKYTSPFFLNFTYCFKNTNFQGILRNYDPITQMYIFCPLTKTFNDEESRRRYSTYRSTHFRIHPKH